MSGPPAEFVCAFIAYTQAVCDMQQGHKHVFHYVTLAPAGLARWLFLYQ